MFSQFCKLSPILQFSQGNAGILDKIKAGASLLELPISMSAAVSHPSAQIQVTKAVLC